MPRRAVDAHVAAEKQRAFLHAEQPERLARVQLVVLNADAVVRHLEPDLLGAEGELDVYARGARRW